MRVTHTCESGLALIVAAVVMTLAELISEVEKVPAAGLLGGNWD